MQGKSMDEIEVKPIGEAEQEPGEVYQEEREPGELVVGLDIGTTKICCVVVEVFEDAVDIIGVGTAPSVGLKKRSGGQY